MGVCCAREGDDDEHAAFDFCISARGPYPDPAIDMLREGNNFYLAGLAGNSGVGNLRRLAPAFSGLMEQAWLCVIQCSSSPVPPEDFLGVRPRELVTLCLQGGVGELGCDGAAAGVELTLVTSPKLTTILVLETRGSAIVKAEMRRVLDSQPGPAAPGAAAAAVRDATQQLKHDRSFDEMCETAELFTVWASIHELLRASKVVRSQVVSRQLAVHGGLLDPVTGAVTFLGEHPRQTHLLMALQEEYVVSKLTVSAEETLSLLRCGNMRSVSHRKQLIGKQNPQHRPKTVGQLDVEDSRRQPRAVVLISFDMKHPVEVLFDSCHGQILTLRSDGNTLNPEAWSGSLIPTMEYSIKEQHARLLVVMGHCPDERALAVARQIKEGNGQTKAGVKRKDTTSLYPASKGLDEFLPIAREALQEAPSASVEELAERTVYKNVFATMAQVFDNSSVVRSGVFKGRVQVIGAVVSKLGECHWLGQHPEQERLCRAHVTPRRPIPAEASIVAAEIMVKLQVGNKRYRSSSTSNDQEGRAAHATLQPPVTSEQPVAVVLCGAEAEVRSPDRLFDIKPGQLLVQRACGPIAGQVGGDLQASLEFLVTSSGVSLLLILCDVLSPSVSASVSSVRKSKLQHASPNAQLVYDQLATPVLRAIDNDENKLSKAEKWARIRSNSALVEHEGEDLKLVTQAAVEQNVRYIAERLMADSVVISSKVKAGQLSLHGAVAFRDGTVSYLGQI